MGIMYLTGILNMEIVDQVRSGYMGIMCEIGILNMRIVNQMISGCWELCMKMELREFWIK